MLRRFAVLLLLLVGICLQSCVPAGAALTSYADNYDGYQFTHPTGWVEVKVDDGPDVVFHDLIEITENASVVINPAPDGKTLEQLGSPSEVGYRLFKNAIAPPGSGREADLISADSKKVGNETYYLLEYAVKLPSQERHNLASVVLRRGNLYTFNLSATEKRWQKKESLFRQIVNSFSVY